MKREPARLFFAAFASFCFVVSPVRSLALSCNPAGWWKLDESSGTLASDASGNANHGSLSNSPLRTTGVFGNALQFTNSNQKVSIPSSTVFDLTNAITLSVWIKPTQAGNSGPSYSHFFTRGDPYTQNWGLAYTDSRTIIFQMTGQNGNSIVSAATVPTNLWTHVVATFDGSTARIYLNGLLDQSATWTGTRSINADAVSLGALDASSSLTGFLDDARVYGCALTEVDIVQLYAAGDKDLDRSPDVNEAALGTDPNNRDSDSDGFADGLEREAGTDPSNASSHPNLSTLLKGWWALDEGIGTTTADNSGNGSGGTFSGAPLWTTGVISNALQFTGIGFVTCGVGGTNSPLAVTNLTVGFWAYVTNKLQTVGVVSRKDPNGPGYLVEWQTNYNRVVLIMPGAPDVPVSLSDVTTNAWNHFAFSYDGTNTVRAYLNGQLRSSGAYTNVLGSSSQALRLGRGPAGSSRYRGTLDDVRVYARPLADGDLLALAEMDTDGDGLPNAQETRLGTNPNSADSDGDGIPDGWEVANGLSPTNPLDALLDPDNDGLNNLQEYQKGTDPNNPDTDGDQIPDGDDPYPLDPNLPGPAPIAIHNAYGIYTTPVTIQLHADARSTNAAVTVAAAEYFLDSTNGMLWGHGTAMLASDGLFNSTNEAIQAVFSPSFPAGERHIAFIHARGTNHAWSAFAKAIINPNVDDILDKIQANYSQIGDITYTVTRRAYIEDQVVSTNAVLFRQKGPYRMRWDDQTTGAITIVSSNSVGVIDESGQLTPMYVATGDDATAENNKITLFYWDVERFRTQHSFSPVAAITNQVASYRITGTPNSGTPNPYDSISADVDFRYGAVTGVDYQEGGETSLRIEQPSQQEVAPGIWFHSQHNSVIPVAEWDIRRNEELQMSTIQINSGGISDSLFDF